MAKLTKKSPRIQPVISTASLPDIIFILLFFFMVVAIIKNDNLLINVLVPDASELSKLQRYDELNHIYVGTPVKATEGTAPRIQLNDAFANVEDIQPFIAANPEKYSTTLHIDEGVTMGVVTDVKTELRKARELHVHYAANREIKKD